MHLVTVSGLPVERACQAVGRSRATYYRPLVQWTQRDALVIEALTALSASNPRWGILEVCGPVTEHRSAVESQTALARVLPAPAQWATPDEEAGAGASGPATGCEPAAERGLGGRFHA